MEPYAQPDNSFMDIYGQVHIHYTFTIEAEELDGYGNFFDPTNYPELGTAVQNHRNADTQVAKAYACGPNDNYINRVRGMKYGQTMWT